MSLLFFNFDPKNKLQQWVFVCYSEMGVIERFDSFLRLSYRDFPMLNILEVNGWK